MNDRLLKKLHLPPPLPAVDSCLFLDVDGTLIDFTANPAAAYADPGLKDLLGALAAGLGGALALVSGRSIASLDRLFDPLRLAAAGLHGSERRSAAGELHGDSRMDPRLDPARERLRAFTIARPQTWLEDKARALALHFNAAPQFECAARGEMRMLAAQLGEAFQVLDGHMVVELKPSGRTKATAIDAFLEEAPFLHRVPIFIGDDLTDRDGFAAVDARGGMSIAVGDRVRGQYRCANPQAVRAWLADFAATLNPRADASPAICPGSR
jgi:trehalose 6-phosphate phosphatase